MSTSPEHSAPGAVELREDVPLKAGGGGGALCGGGPRAILGAFAALSLAITVALLTQIYYGDYEVVPHGSVSSSAAPCSGAGAAALRAGGGAADAALAAALCLAVLAPHRTSLDASGAAVYWEYRSSRTQQPALLEWGGPAAAAGNASDAGPPRLLVALAALHARYAALPWSDALQPAIQLARQGFPVSEGLAAAAAARGLAGYPAAAQRSEPALADYLAALQHNSSGELCAAWDCAGSVSWAAGGVGARVGGVGGWRAWVAGEGGRQGLAALQAALAAERAAVSADDVFQSVVKNLQTQAVLGGQAWPRGVASGVAVVDPRDTYVALVTGLSVPFGSEAAASPAPPAAPPAAWWRDSPAAPLDLAPAILADQNVCGTRYVLGAEGAAALAEGGAAALGGGADGAVQAVERARLLVLPGGALASEPGRVPPALPAPLPPPAPLPLPALNFVQQRGDALLSHADSRGGGVASRF